MIQSMPEIQSYAERKPQFELTHRHIPLLRQLMDYRISCIQQEIGAREWGEYANQSAAQAEIQRIEKSLEHFFDEACTRQVDWNWKHFETAMGLLDLPMHQLSDQQLRRFSAFDYHKPSKLTDKETLEAHFLNWQKTKVAIAAKELFSLCLGFQEYEQSGKHGDYLKHVFGENEQKLAVYRAELANHLGVPQDGVNSELLKAACVEMRKTEATRNAARFMDATCHSYEALARDDEAELPSSFKRFRLQLDGNEAILGSHLWMFHEAVKAVYDITRMPSESPGNTMTGGFMVAALCQRGLHAMRGSQAADIERRRQ